MLLMLPRSPCLPCSLPPLKLIIMSATLRVADFTENEKLFSERRKNLPVISVPGRTHPVTIHHSKETELDDYLGEAVKKVCKIHRKLPEGGILVFLTGKDEILRCVKKLRNALECRTGLRKPRHKLFFSEVGDGAGDSNDLRDKDNDEEEANAFGSVEAQLDNCTDDEQEDLLVADEFSRSNPVHILPLYSMLSAEEQAKVFQSPPAGHRLIVVATNVAETSITIPNIAYVVDTGREKRRNYNQASGVVSYDVDWISQAAADQRAGRAGRTGPGHCYRLYSSSVYSRSFEKFSAPEMTTRPIEDVVLAMKSMNIMSVATFPFPTSPNRGQLRSAVRLLENLACLTKGEDGAEGSITELGKALAKLPVGVRFAKMLLAGVGAGLQDFTILLVGCLSEQSPFLFERESEHDKDDAEEDEAKQSALKTGDDKLDVVDDAVEQERRAQQKLDEKAMETWRHGCGDSLARLLAAGACQHAGGSVGGATEEAVCKSFCKANRLNFTVLSRVQQMRAQLTRIISTRLGVDAGKEGAEKKQQERRTVIPALPPPSKLEQSQISQLLCSGFLDNVARRAIGGEIVGENGVARKDAYVTCNGNLKEPIYLSSRCALYDKQWSKLPEFVVYESIVQRQRRGANVAFMSNVTRIEPEWLSTLGKGSPLLVPGKVVDSPKPRYDAKTDRIVCYREFQYGEAGWKLPPIVVGMRDVIEEVGFKESVSIQSNDHYMWFARSLISGGDVFPELQGLKDLMKDSPAAITQRKQLSRVVLLVSELEKADVDCKKKFEEKILQDDKFLWDAMKSWCSKEERQRFKKKWGAMVKGIHEKAQARPRR